MRCCNRIARLTGGVAHQPAVNTATREFSSQRSCQQDAVLKPAPSRGYQSRAAKVDDVLTLALRGSANTVRWHIACSHRRRQVVVRS